MSIYVRASLFRMKIMYFKIANRTLTAINLTPCIIHHTPMDVAKFFKTQLMVTLRLTHFLAHSYWYTLNLGFLNVHIRRMDRNYDLPAIDCSSLHLDLQLYNYICGQFFALQPLLSYCRHSIFEKTISFLII